MMKEKKIKKSDAASDDDSSCLFSRLPDEIVLQVLNKLIELKTLRCCKLVSRRFYLIVQQVDAVAFTVLPSADKHECFEFEVKSLSTKFTTLKSLCIHLPDFHAPTWSLKYKIKFSTRTNSFLFISPNSVSDSNKNKLLSYVNVNERYIHSEVSNIGFKYLEDTIRRFRVLYWCTLYFPLLEKVSIMDSRKRERVSVSGGKIAEVSKCGLKKFNRVGKGFISSLELPVSGYIMKGVTIISLGREDLPHGSDNFIDVISSNYDRFEDKEEDVYDEAMTEIFNNHRKWITRLSGIEKMR